MRSCKDFYSGANARTGITCEGALAASVQLEKEGQVMWAITTLEGLLTSQCPKTAMEGKTARHSRRSTLQRFAPTYTLRTRVGLPSGALPRSLALFVVDVGLSSTQPTHRISCATPQEGVGPDDYYKSWQRCEYGCGWVICTTRIPRIWIAFGAGFRMLARSWTSSLPCPAELVQCACSST